MGLESPVASPSRRYCYGPAKKISHRSPSPTGDMRDCVPNPRPIEACCLLRMPDATDSPFPATRWSLVQRLREPGAGQSTAMDELCRLYWRPIYLYARRDGHSQQDAEDLTQSFFAALIENATIAAADERRGRLRTFLLTAFQRFAVNAWRHENRLKRGGGVRFTGLDELESSLPAASSPDAAYDRGWACTLVAEAEGRLERDYTARGRGELYHRLRPLLAWNSAPDGAADSIAGACGLTPGAVRVALKRLRESWRRGIEEAVAATLTDNCELEEEVRWLLRVYAG